MNGPRGWFIVGLALWIGGGLQFGLANHLALVRATPDFGLIILSVFGLWAHRGGGTVLGLFAGLLQGALIGANLTAYVVTRSITGFFLGWFAEFDLVPNAALAFTVTFLTTIGAQLLLMFGVHRGPILPFLGGTLLEAVTNGVLAIPIYMIAVRLASSTDR